MRLQKARDAIERAEAEVKKAWDLPTGWLGTGGRDRAIHQAEQKVLAAQARLTEIEKEAAAEQRAGERGSQVGEVHYSCGICGREVHVADAVAAKAASLLRYGPQRKVKPGPVSCRVCGPLVWSMVMQKT